MGLNTQKKREIMVFVAGFTVIVLLLTPYASNGIWFDDALNSQVYFLLKKSDLGLASFSFSIVESWFVSAGRLMLCFFYSYPLFYFFHEGQVLRLVHCFSVIGNIYVWSLVLKRAGVSNYALISWTVVLAGLFQINSAGLDPVAAFAFHYQVLSFQLSVSLLLFYWWMNSLNSWRRMLFSLSTWLLFVFSYEVNAIFVPIAFFLLYLKFCLRARFAYVSIAVFAALYLVITWWVKMAAPSGYDGVQLALNDKVVSVYLMQLSGSLPFSAYFFQASKSIDFTKVVQDSLQSFVSVSILFVGFFVLYFSTKVVEWRQAREGILISACMIFIPAVFPAISARYQNEVGWGAATLPVYYQWFGMALFIVFGISFFCRYKILHVLLIFLFSSYMALNFTVNREVVKSLDLIWRKPRDAFENFSKNGGLSSVRDGDVVVMGSQVPHYVNGSLIYEWSGLKVFVPSDDHNWSSDVPSSNSLVYEVNWSGEQFSLEPVKVSHTFSSGWSGQEDGHRWSLSSTSEILVDNYSDRPVDVDINFGLGVLREQVVSIWIGESLVRELSIDEHRPADLSIPWAFKPGRTVLKIATNRPPSVPGNGDARVLSFKLLGLKLD